jgi:PLP dependent protein
MNNTMPPEVVSERLADVRDRISEAGGHPGLVRVVAVTKGFGADAVTAAVEAGLFDIGENYAQELLSKLGAAPHSVRWHFLGELQRNKLSRLAPHVFLWQGLDSMAEAEALAFRCPGAAVLVEVKLGGGDRRHGVSLAEAPDLVSRAGAAGLDVQGLMTVAPPRAGRDEVRQGFRAVARLARSLGLRELSMGMSGDFELAAAEGATIVRLGRVLFGPRPGGAPTQMYVARAWPG